MKLLGQGTPLLRTRHPLIYEFIWFLLKQAWASIFGGLMLLGILVSGFYYPDIGIARYDMLVIYAVLIQATLLIFRLESWREVCVIFLFHLMATAMELFKTSDAIASWAYPEESVLKIGNVPLFAGFMYSAVGSYMARAWRGLYYSFTDFPPLWIAGLLAVLAYLNYFTHHFIVDIRWVLIGVGIVVFRKTRISFKPKFRRFEMRLLFGFALVALVLWIAENFGTFAKAWVYPNQAQQWEMVSISKFTAWYLLMQLSFILIYALRVLESKLGVAGPRIQLGKSI